MAPYQAPRCACCSSRRLPHGQICFSNSIALSASHSDTHTHTVHSLPKQALRTHTHQLAFTLSVYTRQAPFVVLCCAGCAGHCGCAMEPV